MNASHNLKMFVNKIGLLYTQMICKREYLSQEFSDINERPVELEFLFRQLTKTCPRTILDVGTGLTALPHIMRNCGFVVTSIDNIKDYWPRGFINRHFYVINDDITKTRLDNKFDFIACISVLEHIKDHRAAVRSMLSLLNPGGHLILTFPYNEKNYIENVYKVSGSNVKGDAPFTTQVYSRKELDLWTSENWVRILEQEYWRFFTGEYWTVGEMICPPLQVDKNEPHQISCIMLQKGNK